MYLYIENLGVISLWIILQATTPAEFMPYIDKIGTVALALIIAYLMYKELQRKDKQHSDYVELLRKEFAEKEDKYREDLKELKKELLGRLDEQRFQVNDLIKAFTRKTPTSKE